MIAWSIQPPPRFDVSHERGGEMCEIRFYTDTKVIPTENGDYIYRSEVLYLCLRYQRDIIQDINNRYTEWLTLAKEGG